MQSQWSTRCDYITGTQIGAFNNVELPDFFQGPSEIVRFEMGLATPHVLTYFF